MNTKKYGIKDFLEVKSASSPSFSPDGEKISFLSNITGTQQLYIVSSKGGEPEQITSYEDPISFAVFSPTKEEIVFGKSKGGDEKTQFFIYSLETKEIKDIVNEPEIKHVFGQFSRDGKYISYSDNKRNGKDFDVYIRDMETGEVKCVYSDGGDCSAGGFSPKNTYLTIKKKHSNFNVDLYLYSLDSGEIELITPHEGDIYFSGTMWLNDESSFYTITNKDRDFMGLIQFNMKDREFRYVLTPEWDVDSANISFDGKLISVIVNEDGYNKTTIYNVESFKEISLNSIPKTYEIYSLKFSKDSKKLALVIGDSTHTSDIWIYNLEDEKFWQITNSAQGVPSDDLVQPEIIRFKSFDGLEVPAFIYMPKDVKEGEKTPVIFYIHGGPESQYKPGLALLIQYFIYQGYAVVAPNVRGSSGYGKKYLALDDVEKRLDSVRDLSSLHDHIKNIPQLDVDKVVLMGGSYGGYMVLAGLAFYPDLWVGGVDIVGIANFITFLENTASYRRANREAEYGSLEKNREFLYSISPINHVDKIKAPLFVIHGANDPRVPLSEAEQIVEKLTSEGKKAELLVYKDEGHGLSKLKNRLDAYPKIFSFLEEIFNK